MTPQETIRALAAHVKAAVVPHLGTWRARRVTGIASSGDATFDIDDIAEEAVESYIHANDLNVAYYSEDRGLVHPFPGRDPDGILIIDPIDGTRAAVAGLESCVVSVAWTAYKPAPTMGDVLYGAITEIKGNLTLSAVRGQGVEIVDGAGNRQLPAPLPTTEIETMACAIEVVGAPMQHIFSALNDMTSRTTVRGGLFILNSSAFELTRLVTGQMAGIIDVRNRLIRDYPSLRDEFVTYGGGRLLCLYGYDIAAAGLIAQEAGCVVTDAWGRSLDDWNLLDTTEANFGSMIAASNPTLHARIVESVNASFAAYRV